MHDIPALPPKLQLCKAANDRRFMAKCNEVSRSISNNGAVKQRGFRPLAANSRSANQAAMLHNSQDFIC
jgi:hypothetical protein